MDRAEAMMADLGAGVTDMAAVVSCVSEMQRHVQATLTAMSARLARMEAHVAVANQAAAKRRSNPPGFASHCARAPGCHPGVAGHVRRANSTETPGPVHAGVVRPTGVGDEAQGTDARGLAAVNAVAVHTGAPAVDGGLTAVMLGRYDVNVRHSARLEEMLSQRLRPTPQGYMEPRPEMFRCARSCVWRRHGPGGCLEREYGARPVIPSLPGNERQMWSIVRATRFYNAIEQHVQVDVPLTRYSWLKFNMQVSHLTSPADLLRVFQEADTMAVLATVINSKETRSAWVDSLWLVLLGVMHPNSSVKLQWDLTVLVLLYTVCFITPYVICFQVDVPQLSVIGIWDQVVSSVFVLDIFMNFRTALYLPGMEMPVSSRILIAKHYICGRFLVDLISTMPWDTLALAIGNSSMGLVRVFKAVQITKVAKAYRMLKMIRMLGLVKAPPILRKLEANVGRMVIRLVSVVTINVVLLHFFACVFHFVATLEEVNVTWVEASGLVDSSSRLDRYLASLYWAMSTLATVGYGDVTPILTSEKLVAMLCISVGVTVFATFTATISSVVALYHVHSTFIEESAQELDAFLRRRREIPGRLVGKVKSFHDGLTRGKLRREDRQLIEGLPSALKQQIVLTIYEPLVAKMPALWTKHPQLLEELLPQLQHEFYPASEHVALEGDISAAVHFVADGVLEMRKFVGDEWETCQSEMESSDPGSESKIRPVNATGLGIFAKAAMPEENRYGLSVIELGARKWCRRYKHMHMQENDDQALRTPSSVLKAAIHSSKALCSLTGRLTADFTGERRARRSRSFHSTLSKGRKGAGMKRTSSFRSVLSMSSLPKTHRPASFRMLGMGKAPFRQLGFIREGCFFGADAALDAPHQFSVTTVSQCKLYSLDSKRLKAMLDRWPDLYRTLRIGEGGCELDPRVAGATR